MGKSLLEVIVNDKLALPVDLFTDQDFDVESLKSTGQLSPTDCLLPLRSMRKIFGPNNKLISFALVDERYLTFLIKFVNNSKRAIRGSRRRGQASTGYWQVGYDDLSLSLRPPHTTTKDTKTGKAIRFSLNRVVYLLDKIHGTHGTVGLFNAMAQFMTDKELLYQQTLVAPKLMFINGVVLDCRASNITPIRTVISGRSPYNNDHHLDDSSNEPPEPTIAVESLGRRYTPRSGTKSIDDMPVFTESIEAKPNETKSPDTTTLVVSNTTASNDQIPPEILVQYSRINKQTLAGWVMMYGSTHPVTNDICPWIIDWAQHSYEAIESELKTLELIGDTERLKQLYIAWDKWKLETRNKLELEYPGLRKLS